MLGMFSADIFDTEVVNDQAELNGPPFVSPQARSSDGLKVALLLQTLPELVVS